MYFVNTYWWYAIALIWSGIILGLLTFATYGTGFIISDIVFWARIVAQILGVAFLFVGGIFFHWVSKQKDAVEKKIGGGLFG
jgi:energy-converting hydrogenase Eha subunit F